MGILSGQTFKGYEIHESIGQGAFGAVYRAHQTVVDREVAIKVILPQYANQPDFIRRFETEAQFVARLEHLHIVPLYDYWRDPDGAYLVMRYLRGGSLKDWIGKGALDPGETLRLVEQIAQALAVAHRHGIVHRDIKPSNILLDEERNAYLADFGIAKVVGGEPSVEGLRGTLDYISPEQIRSQPVTAQTDVYALGIVLYEMLTGAQPFSASSTPAELLHKHLETPVPDVQTKRDGLPGAVDEVIQTATAKTPTERYPDAPELARALREALTTAKLAPAVVEQPLIEPLTDRELEVLRLMGEGLKHAEIAQKLVLAVTTVKWYAREIYGKLGVRNRRQAVVVGQRLGLLGGVPERRDIALPDWMVGHNPYKGLAAFQQADAPEFFGRESIAAKIIQRMGEKHDLVHFLAVIGPSGSGKTSLVKAGLVPALLRGDLPGSDRWYVIDMMPGDRPLDKLEVALTRIAADQAANLYDHLSRDDHGLVRIADLILPDDDSELVIVIDQFEEVFTLVESEARRVHFLDLIHTAVTAPRSRVRIVVTMRADFYDRPLHYPAFGELMRDRGETVLPLSAEELERAIVKPAEQVGVTFEEGLVATIIDEALYQPGALPLLQYALTELFERRDSRVLTHENYQAIGGTVGALAKRADEIYVDYNDIGQEMIRQMFLRLVTLGEGTEDTRRRVPRNELIAIVDDVDLMDDIIDTFASERLLAMDHDPATRTPTVEVAHEALLREWEQLRTWLNDSRDDIKQQRQLAALANDWHKNAQDASYLTRGTRLEQFQLWAEETQLNLTPREQEYLATSVATEAERTAKEQAQIERENRLRQQRQRVLQGLVAVFLMAAIVAGGLALFAFDQQATAKNERDKAGKSEQEARRQASIGFAAQAMLELDGKFPDRAVPLALEALEDYPYSWQAERALGQAVLSNRLQLELTGHSTAISHVLWSPDANLLASASIDGNVIIWNATTGELLHQIPTQQGHLIWIDWSPTGDRIVTTDFVGAAKVWDVPTGEEVITFTGHEQAIYFAEWSPDGSRIMTSSLDTTAKIWDAVTGETLQTFTYDDMVGAVAWSPQGDQVVVSDFTGRVVIWDAATGAEVRTLEGHESWLNRVRWSSSTNRILSASDEGSTIVWDAKTGEMLLKLAGHKDWVLDAQWSPDERTIVTYSRDRTTRIWDAVTGEELSVFSPGDPEIKGSLSPLQPLAFSPSDNRFAIIRFDGSFSVLDSSTGYKYFTLPGHAGLIISIDWSRSDRLATGSEDGTVRIWDMSPRVLTLEHIGDPVMVDWSPDGAWIASSSGDGTARIRDAASGKEQDVFTVHAGPNSVIHWAPDSRRVAATESEQSIEVIDTATGEVLVTFDEHQAPVFDFAWSPTGNKIASTDVGGTVWVWDSRSGEPLVKYEGHQDRWVSSVDWSPDGALIVSTDAEGEAHIWKASTGERQQILPAGYGLVSQARWSPDGSMIATHTDDNVGGRIWDAESGEILMTFKGHSTTVWGMDWSSSGDRLVTTSMDGYVKIWNAHSGVELVQYAFPFPLSNVAWSPDDHRIAFGSGDGSVRIVDLPWHTTEQLIEYARECCVTRELTPEERALFGLPERGE